MTTSGAISGQMTAAQLVTAALQDIGAIAAGETPEASELELGIRTLNWMLKSWAQAQGANLWREEQGSVTFSAFQPTATIDPCCLDILEARVVVTPPTPVLTDGSNILVDG